MIKFNDDIYEMIKKHIIALDNTQFHKKRVIIDYFGGNIRLAKLAINRLIEDRIIEEYKKIYFYFYGNKPKVFAGVTPEMYADVRAYILTLPKDDSHRKLDVVNKFNKKHHAAGVRCALVALTGDIIENHKTTVSFKFIGHEVYEQPIVKTYGTTILEAMTKFVMGLEPGKEFEKSLLITTYLPDYTRHYLSKAIRHLYSKGIIVDGTSSKYFRVVNPDEQVETTEPVKEKQVVTYDPTHIVTKFTITTGGVVKESRLRTIPDGSFLITNTVGVKSTTELALPTDLRLAKLKIDRIIQQAIDNNRDVVIIESRPA